FAVGGEQHLRVRGRAERAPPRLELTSKLDVVVDLSVENDGVTPLGVDHRLVPLGREIEDGEPSEAETDPGLPVAHVKSGIVRSAMHLGGAHRAHGFLNPRIDQADRTGDPAHDLTLFSLAPAIATARCAGRGARRPACRSPGRALGAPPM